MANPGSSQTESNQPLVYQIRLDGQLSQQWSAWFGAVTISLEASGTTLLTCTVVDQAALYGLLRKVRDLGMPLISVMRIDCEAETRNR